MENKAMRCGWSVQEYRGKERAVRATQGLAQVKAKISGFIGLNL